MTDAVRRFSVTATRTGACSFYFDIALRISQSPWSALPSRATVAGTPRLVVLIFIALANALNPKICATPLPCLDFQGNDIMFLHCFSNFCIYHNNGEYRRLTSRATTKFSVEMTWLIQKAKFPVQLRYLVHEENYNDHIFQCR